MADFTHVFPNAEQFDTMNALLAIIAANKDNGMEITSWKSIAQIVKMGLGERVFPVGYEFTTEDSDTGVNIVWVVRGHNHHKAAHGGLKHTMTLEMKNVYSTTAGTYKSMQFDAIEALYYAPEGLDVGTYCFTIQSGYDEANGGGKTLSFTLTQPLPAGGQIMFPWASNKQSTSIKISTYASNTATEPLESNIEVSEGENGTNLGTTDGNSENMNYIQRVRYGSNNYAQSALRQWINSTKEAGSVWKPTNKFDRAPSWAATCNGFLHGLPSEFLEVVQPAVIPCRTNSVFEVDSLDGTAFTVNQVYDLKDKFFILSRPEIYGSWDSATYKDGELLSYYDGLTNTERIKRDETGSARHAWLRSPIPAYAGSVRNVNTSGSLDYTYASRTYAVAPACIIA